MAKKPSVVTPERFAKGFTFKDYLAQIKVNKDRFDAFYSSGKLTPDDAAFFRRAAQGQSGIGNMLVLAEDWCPDAFRGVPVMAHIAEAAGMEMRIFPRDQNMDIMNEFLNRGEFQSIPVAVFYTKDLRYICHWIERPESATKEQTRIGEEVRKAMAGASEQDIRAAIRDRTQPRYPAWQQETAREMCQMLSEKLNVK